MRGGLRRGVWAGIAGVIGLGIAAARAAAAGPPVWAVGAPIYEVNLQMFSQAGTYKELQKHLPRLKAQGVGILWLMPITTRGTVKAFGSPYCVKDYKGFHAPYGSAQDFRELVQAVHGQGMRIILDWVPNHSSWDNRLIAEHPEFYKKNADGSIAQAYGWTDVAQLDYGNAGLRAWMIEAMAWWVKEFDVDGFRCDVAWGVPMAFWSEARAALDKVKPLFLLAENNDPAYQSAFDSDYDWNLLHVRPQTLLTDIAAGSKPASAIDAFIQKDLKDYAPGFMRMRFTSNHDEWKDFGTPFQRLKGGVKAFAALTATLPGKPLIYNGQEIGWNPGDRSAAIQWNDTSGFISFYRALLTEHRDNPALHAGSFTRISTDRDGQVYAYVREKGDAKVAVVLNLSDKEVTVRVDHPKMEGAYEDVLDGTSAKFYATNAMALAPWGFRVVATGPRTASLGRPVRRAGRAGALPVLEASGRLTFASPRAAAVGRNGLPELRWDALGKAVGTSVLPTLAP